MMAICVCGGVKRKCVAEDFLERIIREFFPLKKILLEKNIKSV